MSNKNHPEGEKQAGRELLHSQHNTHDEKTTDQHRTTDTI